MAKTAKNKNKPRPKGGQTRSRWKLWLGLAAVVVVLLVCLIYGFWASSFDLRKVQDMAERSSVLDMDGRRIDKLLVTPPPVLDDE